MVNYLRNFNTILDNHPPIITEILSTGIKHCLSSSIFAHDVFSKDWKDYFDALIDDFFDIYFARPFAKCISEKGHGEGYRIFRQPFQSLENEYSNVYTRGGLIAPRGYYCPLPNPLCKVGTKCSKKSMEKNAFDYKFWFEKQELVRVEKYHEEYRENDKELVARISDEYIFRISPSRTVGLHYNTYPTMSDVELDHIILCEYEGERLIRYIDMGRMEKKHRYFDMRYEEYDYIGDVVTTYAIEVNMYRLTQQRGYRLISY